MISSCLISSQILPDFVPKFQGAFLIVSFLEEMKQTLAFLINIFVLLQMF